jgi:hypothetical protein
VPDQAQPLYEHTLTIFEQAYGPDHPTFAMVRTNLTY